MARRTADEGVVSRLAGRGEDAVTRLMDELGRNSVVTDALARAMSAKGRLDSASRGALGQIGLAAADEISDLQKQVGDLERRIAKLEAGAKTSSSGAGRSGRSAATTTKSTTTAKSRSRSGSSGTSRSTGRRSNPPA